MTRHCTPGSAGPSQARTLHGARVAASTRPTGSGGTARKSPSASATCPPAVRSPRRRSANLLRFGLDPENVSLELTGIGPRPQALSAMSLAAELESPELSAYGQLLHSVLSGDSAFAIRSDEAEESWRVVRPVLEAWAKNAVPLRDYPVGSDGPARCRGPWSSCAASATAHNRRADSRDNSTISPDHPWLGQPQKLGELSGSRYRQWRHHSAQWGAQCLFSWSRGVSRRNWRRPPRSSME
jgi:Glucose-6-phosphate dehydrogenase, C-terminal domain